MRKRLHTIATVGALVSASAHAATIGDFYGKWRLDTQVGSQDVAGPDDGKHAVGQEMVISADRSVSPAGDCATFPPRYAVKSVSSVLQEWLIKPNWLTLGEYKLPGRAGVVETACPEAIVLTPNELLVNLSNGYIYLASRVK